jgi:orotidine-5'-phosphate decarboxylase
VLGLDPDPSRLWPGASAAAEDDVAVGAAGEQAPGGLAAGRRQIPEGLAGSSPAARASRAVLAHCRLVIEAVGTECVAVKPQVACFERLGAPGWAALEQLVGIVREHGLLVIADAKRGDIDVTAAAYGQAFFGPTETPFGTVPGLGVDALTVNPLLGGDSLLPLVAAASAVGAGLFVLVRTSNPGAADVQDQTLRDGASVSDRLAVLVADLGADHVGKARISAIGAVVGATAPEHLERLRRAMPAAPFLLPGVGAQGGSVNDLAPAFAPGPAGGIVAASRGIVYAFEKSGQTPERAARTEAARLRELAWSVASQR